MDLTKKMGKWLLDHPEILVALLPLVVLLGMACGIYDDLKEKAIKSIK